MISILAENVRKGKLDIPFLYEISWGPINQFFSDK